MDYELKESGVRTIPFEQLADELSSLDNGIAELIARREHIRRQINEQREKFNEFVNQSDDKFYTLTRGESEGMPTEPSEVPYDRHNTKASGGHY